MSLVSIQNYVVSHVQMKLNDKSIGLQDSFFDVGADSLAIQYLCRKVQEEYDVDLTLELLYSLITLDNICEYILKQLNTD